MTKWILTGDGNASDEIYEKAWQAFGEASNDGVNGYGNAAGIDGLAAYGGGTNHVFDPERVAKAECFAKCWAKANTDLVLDQIKNAIGGKITKSPLGQLAISAVNVDTNGVSFGKWELFELSTEALSQGFELRANSLEKIIKNKAWKLPGVGRASRELLRENYIDNLNMTRDLHRGSKNFAKKVRLAGSEITVGLFLQDLYGCYDKCESGCTQ